MSLNIAAANRDPEVFADPGTFDPERSGPPALTFGAEPRICPGRNHALALAAGVLDRAPAETVEAMVKHVLTLADTWTAWDGRPVPVDDRVYTPHKAIRRVADHLVDHLAEMEARLVGEQPQADHWHASETTTRADLAPFTQADLDEAHSRLSRLARIWSNRLGSLTPGQLDHSPAPDGPSASSPSTWRARSTTPTRSAPSHPPKAGTRDRLLRTAPRRPATAAPQRLGPRLCGGPGRSGLRGDRHDESGDSRGGRTARRYGRDPGGDPRAGQAARRGPFLLSVDAEGGFGDDPAEVAGFARELAAAGAVGINLEDGRGDGTLTPVRLHAAKVAAVKAAVPDLFVNARTDTHWLDTGRAETSRRLHAYQAAGADGVFVPGLCDPTEIAALVRTLDVPLNILYSPAGPTVTQLGELGVRRVSLGSLLFRTALGAAVAAATDIRAGRPLRGGTAPTYTEVQRLSR